MCLQNVFTVYATIPELLFTALVLYANLRQIFVSDANLFNTGRKCQRARPADLTMRVVRFSLYLDIDQNWSYWFSVIQSKDYKRTQIARFWTINKSINHLEKWRVLSSVYKRTSSGLYLILPLLWLINLFYFCSFFRRGRKHNHSFINNIV